MTAHLTDRMPEVARGDASWSTAEAAHLAGCADCRREWRLLGAIAPATATLDLERITAGVLAGLREPAPVAAPRRWRWPVGLAAAASIAMAFALWQSAPAGDPAPGLAVGSDFVPTLFPELDLLLESELEVVLAAVTPDEPTVESTPIGDLPRLGDLTDDELEQLLDAVEG